MISELIKTKKYKNNKVRFYKNIALSEYYIVAKMENSIGYDITMMLEYFNNFNGVTKKHIVTDGYVPKWILKDIEAIMIKLENELNNTSYELIG